LIKQVSQGITSTEGAMSHAEIARNKAKEILKNHQPMALNNEVDILDIIAEYENK
jgi:hypothetical protein